MKTLLLYLFVLSNIFIVCGYFFVGLRIVPNTGVNMLRTKIGGILFFITCGITHMEMAWHAFTGEGFTIEHMISFPMVINHMVQALSVWMFVTGLYIEFVKWGPWGRHWDKMLEDERC